MIFTFLRENVRFSTGTQCMQKKVVSVSCQTDVEKPVYSEPKKPQTCEMGTQCELIVPTIDGDSSMDEDPFVADDEAGDPTYAPEHELPDMQEVSVDVEDVENLPPHLDAKFLVFKSNLLDLFY